MSICLDWRQSLHGKTLLALAEVDSFCVLGNIGKVEDTKYGNRESDDAICIFTSKELASQLSYLQGRSLCFMCSL